MLHRRSLLTGLFIAPAIIPAHRLMRLSQSLIIAPPFDQAVLRSALEKIGIACFVHDRLGVPPLAGPPKQVALLHERYGNWTN